MGGVDPGGEIEFLDPLVRARAHAGGAEPQLPWTSVNVPAIKLARTEAHAVGGLGLVERSFVRLSGFASSRVRVISYARCGMRLIVARCSVEYTGRLTAHLPEALRLIMLKADGSVLVHADAGGYKPLNSM
jgi:hypothetical protein